MNRKPDVSCLHGKTVILPGGYDKEGRPLLLVSIPCDAPLTDITPSLHYLLSLFSQSSRTRGITVIVDARKSPWRVARSSIKQVTKGLDFEELSQLIVLRPDAFWDKQRVESCTNVQYDGQVIFIPRSRLNKFVDHSQLPQELGGNFIYNHEQWIENRRRVEDFYADYEITIKELNELHHYLAESKNLKSKELENAIKTASDMIDTTRMLVLNVTETGRQLLQSLEYDNRIRKFASEFGSMTTPQEILDTFERIDEILTTVRRKQQQVDESYAELERSFVDTKDLRLLENGIVKVTNWIMGTGETLLNAKQGVGYDLATAEELRKEHEAIELQFWETYGAYAELRHKIESYPKAELMSPRHKELLAQKDFMDYVCRIFATRLERRRNILMTSIKFFRLVSEYFDKTGEVFDSLVMGNKDLEFSTAAMKLKQLLDSQVYLDAVKRELVKEGEKLTEMLSVPMKDCLGREVTADYKEDIINIRDMMDATNARKNIFTDSVEVQKLNLEQICHITNYEKDVVQATQWLDELFHFLLRDHGYVGSTVYEIQQQKDEHQTFQETAKDTYNYGCQLLSASLVLRQLCKLPVEDHNRLSEELENSWQLLKSVSQEQMARLRVSAIFHRSVEEHCNQLKDLKEVAVTMSSTDAKSKETKLKHYSNIRERLLIEVDRTVRLGKLLKSRLKEPLYYNDIPSEPSSLVSIDFDLLSEDSLSLITLSEESQPYTGENERAIEAISERLTSVNDLIEELDKALQNAQQGRSSPSSSPPSSKNEGRILDSPRSTMENNISVPNIEINPPKSEEHKSDEEFQTASSECTLQHSRSSSYNTASENEHRFSPWWDADKNINEDLSKEKMVLAVGLPELPPAKSVLKPSPEVPPGKIVHEVTETTHIKVQHQHTMGVSSFVLTSETVKDKKNEGSPLEIVRTPQERPKETVISVAQENGIEDEDDFARRIREVSGRFEEEAWKKYKQAIKGFV